MRKASVNAFLDNLYSDESFQAIGFKILHRELIRIPSALDYLRRNDGMIIQVIRKNVLKTLVSRSVKKVNRIAHTTGSFERVRVTLPESKLVARLEAIKQSNELMTEAVAGMPYLRVYYEDFIENKARESKRMLEFLKIDSSTELQSSLVKGNSDSLAEIVTNYDAVCRILKGTEFEWCLD